MFTGPRDKSLKSAAFIPVDPAHKSPSPFTGQNGCVYSTSAFADTPSLLLTGSASAVSDPLGHITLTIDTSATLHVIGAVTKAPGPGGSRSIIKNIATMSMTTTFARSAVATSILQTTYIRHGFSWTKYSRLLTPASMTFHTARLITNVSNVFAASRHTAAWHFAAWTKVELALAADRDAPEHVQSAVFVYELVPAITSGCERVKIAASDVTALARLEALIIIVRSVVLIALRVIIFIFSIDAWRASMLVVSVLESTSTAIKEFAFAHTNIIQIKRCIKVLLALYADIVVINVLPVFGGVVDPVAAVIAATHRPALRGTAMIEQVIPAIGVEAAFGALPAPPRVVEMLTEGIGGLEASCAAIAVSVIGEPGVRQLHIKTYAAA
ncbi:hypothetical protein OPT61_g1266 [Boeremia exigua]|uniref:Uncharacterized protein n=1 Tax=Boeremia exigua TaxID=749465 RepID=A0ACC2IQT2_9PLEO|nr:hypothetical protein OPT61_g1266 [Boeremia exigua]